MKHQTDHITPEFITEETRKTLRRKGANFFLSFSNGKTFAPIGGGFVCTGLNTKHVINNDKVLCDIKHLKSIIHQSTAQIISLLTAYTNIESATLIFDLENYQVDQCYAILVKELNAN